MKTQILYEDNHLLVVIKPVNVPVNADNSRDADLMSELKAWLKEKYQKPGNVYLGLIHRLDRPVSGIMVFAKTSKAAGRLSEQVRSRQFEKIYHAVVCARDLPKEDTLEDWLVKDSRTNTTRIADPKTPGAKKASLSYETVETKNGLTLVRIKLDSGRSHQIRVQFASRSFPLWGDQRYNPEAVNGQQIALCATGLCFLHPVTKEKMEFAIDLPNRYPFTEFLQKKTA